MDKFKDQEFLKMICSYLTEKPDEVRLERTVDDRGVLLNLYVAKEDAGKLIGKGGMTAKALRVLLSILGGKENLQISLRVNAIDQDKTKEKPKEKE